MPEESSKGEHERNTKSPCSHKVLQRLLANTSPGGHLHSAIKEVIASRKALEEKETLLCSQAADWEMSTLDLIRERDLLLSFINRGNVMIKSCHHFMDKDHVKFQGDLKSPMTPDEITKEIEEKLPMKVTSCLVEGLSFSGEADLT